jgi:hypothetical protein
MLRPLHALAAGACLAALGLTVRPAAPTALAQANAPTYYRDVAPVLAANCLECHVQGGIAPFRLDEATAARDRAAAIAAAVQSGHMPPWLPGPASPALRDDRRLSGAEKATLVGWAKAGAPLGDKASAARLPARPIAWKADVTLAMPRPYTPNTKLSDDYRCFVVDPQLRQDRFVTAYRVAPGQAGQVHHVILYRLPDYAADSAAALDARDPGEGWTCFGGSGVGGSGEDWLGAWAPGSTGSVLPAGTGAPLAAGEKLVMQVHYNLAGGAKADRSRVDLQYAPAGAKLTPLRTSLLAAPVELPCPSGPTSRACDRTKAAPDGFANSLLAMCGKSLADYARPKDYAAIPTSCDRQVPAATTVYGVAGHMHLRGQSLRIELNPGTKAARVLLDIPRWDFHWQDQHWLRDPLQVKAGDVLRLTCTFDNTARSGSHGAVTPRYVTWGEGTEDEMCLAMLKVSQ